ncbi:hypothetical protein AB9P05_22820 [Roseivirga sp. BDSF3-8]
MKKMKVKLDSLNVESFVTENVKAGADNIGKPTVVTYGWWSYCCGTYTEA